MRQKALFAAAAFSVAIGGYAADGYKDTALVPGTKWHIHDPDRPTPPVVTPGENFSEKAAAPSDAVVLFEGKDFSKWQSNTGGEVKWKIEDGYMETTKSGTVRTRDKFGDFQMHLEFATPEKVDGKGQGRGNNGVNIHGKFEIQVLDSFNNWTYPDGQAGAIYGQTPPLVNAARGPGQWQTYDIVFEGPRWNDAGELTRKASVTVIHNGVVIHNKRELHGGTNHRAIVPYKKYDGQGFIELYEHGNPVRFRNIWIRPLREYDQGEAK